MINYILSINSNLENTILVYNVLAEEPGVARESPGIYYFNPHFWEHFSLEDLLC